MAKATKGRTRLLVFWDFEHLSPPYILPTYSYPTPIHRCGRSLTDASQPHPLASSRRLGIGLK